MTAVPPAEGYAIFAGKILQQSAAQLVGHLVNAAAQGATKYHLLFQSFGGSVGDGIFLYTFFRHAPIPVRIYNGGSVESIAAIAYLGARERVVAPQAAFMFHATNRIGQSPTAIQAAGLAASLALDDARTQEILKDGRTISDAQWAQLRNHELWFSAKDAITSKIATEEGFFSPPHGVVPQLLGGIFA